MTGDYTFLLAVGRGPDLVPLAVRPAARAGLPRPADRGRGRRAGHAARSRPAGPRSGTRVAYVAGFGSVFTLLGITATFAGGVLADYLPALRVIGGAILVVMGLSLAGILRIPILERTWRPLDAGASASLTTMTGGMTLAPAGGGTMGTEVGSRLVGGRAGLGTAFALGAIFAIGWTPCIGVILGGILTLAATADGRLQGALLLVGYTLGLGIPFIIIAAFYDRSQRMVRFLVRHGRAVSLVGGLLVAAIGFAMIFDLLILLPQYFRFTSFV